MAYDQNISSGNLNVELKRRVWRVDFSRPETENGGNSVTAKIFLREDLLDTTNASPTSGSVLRSKNWILYATNEQIFSLPSAGVFFNELINGVNALKNQFDTNGSIPTGSIQILV